MSLKTTTATDDTLVVQGTVGANDAPAAANMEQRIVNPDGFRTNLGKRDIRAVPGPMTAAAKTGTSSYSSMLQSDGTSFTATYVFSDPAVAKVAMDGGGQRLLQWQTVDPAGNRQGVSIAEAGEVGGPGFGGCPAGPAATAAPAAGNAAVIRSTDKTSAKVTWTAATAQPGATAVSGYSVEAIATTATTAGEKPGVVVRTGVDATSTTLALDPAVTYDVEVRSLAGTGLSAPYTIGAVGGTPTGTPKDTVIPTLTVTPESGALTADTAVQATSVSATSDGQIFYTDDGTGAVFADGPSATAKLYTGAIPITKPTNLSFAAFDTAGNISAPAKDGWYTPSTTATAAPTLKATAGPAQGQITLTWNAVTGAASYQVAASKADGTALAPQPPSTTGTTQVITDLAVGDYSFTVSAANAAGTVSPASAPPATASAAAVADTVAISKVTWKAGAELRVIGSTSATTGTVSIYQAKQDATGKPVADTTKAPLIANVALTSAAPAAGSSFDARSGVKLNTKPAAQVVAKLSTGSESPAVTVP
jgi:hypothetical protein